MKALKILLYIVAIAAGIFLFIYGEYDDSPGGQLLGVIIAFGGVVSILRTLRRK